MATIDELKALALQIRDAAEDRENTALKVGQFLYDLLEYLGTKADLTDRTRWHKQLNLDQTPIVALQSIEPIPDSQGKNNKMWWSADDGQLKWKANDEVFPLGNPTYILYYCGKKIYRWDGSSIGFTEMESSGGSQISITAFSDYVTKGSTSELPSTGNSTTGYIVGSNVYAYVGTGGDTNSGKYKNLGQIKGADGVGFDTISTAEDGTIDIELTNGDIVTINLNHTHPNMAKLIVCEESDLPSTLANDTIYAITDSGETEIEKLIIKGMEFAGGGGTPSTDQRITSPIGTQIDFNGASTKTVTVRATNLSEALTIAVTGMTASLQTISASDAANGVQLTLTKGQNFTTGTLRIYSSEVDKSWGVIDSQGYQDITAVKFTRQQKVLTDIYPGPNTRIEIDMKFDGEYLDCSSGTGRSYALFGTTDDENYNPKKVFRGNTGVLSQMQDTATTFSLFIWAETGYVNETYEIKVAKTNWKNRSTLILDMVNHQASFNGASTTVQTKTTTMQTPMMFGSNPTSANPFGFNEIILYSLKHYEDNVLTHEYLPKTLNGIAGLYDTKTETFITSETNVELEAINS